MGYRIFVLEKDSAYVERLIEFFTNHYNESFIVDMLDSSKMLTDIDWNHIVLDKSVMGREVTAYDVIFIGDDIGVSLYDIPLGVRVAYLSGKRKSDDDLGSELIVSKYQRLEQIYHQMLKICENTSDRRNDYEEKNANKQEPICTYIYTRFGDYELDIEDSFEGTYRIYKLAKTDVLDSVSIGMITNNQIPGLATVIESDGFIKYDITDKINIVDLLKKNNNANGKSKLLKIINNISKTMLAMEDFMLEADRIILKPQDIYVDENTMECTLLYYPLKSAEVINRDSLSLCACLKEFIGIFSEINNLVSEKSYKSKTDYDVETNEEFESKDTEYGRTEIFDELQHLAKESIGITKKTSILSDSDGCPYLIRRKNGEKVLINRNIFKIGKDDSYVDYCIKDNPTVSRNHADIVKRARGYYIMDRGSLNHTFLNGKRLDEEVAYKLENEDLVQIADEIFVYYDLVSKIN